MGVNQTKPKSVFITAEDAGKKKTHAYLFLISIRHYQTKAKKLI